MIAKIIAYGRTRDEALARLRRAMAETTVVIEGGATNKSFILDLLDQPEVVDGDGRLGRHRLDRPGPRRGPARRPRALRHRRSSPPASRPTRTRTQVEIARLLETARGGRPQVQHKVGRAVDLKLRGTTYKVTVLQIGPHRFRVAVAGRRRRRRSSTPSVERLDEFHSPADRRRPALPRWSPPPTARCTWSRSTASPTGSAATRAACCARPRPALVVATPVAVGDVVAAGAPVLVLESMKMETVLRAPFAGAGRASCW